MKKVLLVLSSVRENRSADNILELVKQQFEGHDVEIDVADFKQNPLPFFDAPVPPSAEEFSPTDENVIMWRDQVATADVVVMLASENNYSYSAVLKNAIDWLFSEWTDKPVAFVGYGWSGGSKAIGELRALMTGFLKAQLVETDASLAFTKDINLDGTPLGDEAKAKINQVIEAVTK